jgi:hypothetical protein
MLGTATRGNAAAAVVLAPSAPPPSKPPPSAAPLESDAVILKRLAREPAAVPAVRFGICAERLCVLHGKQHFKLPERARRIVEMKKTGAGYDVEYSLGCEWDVWGHARRTVTAGQIGASLPGLASAAITSTISELPSLTGTNFWR